MASTNKTAHYEFPQYIGSDIPNILTDINPAFETIDTALYEQGQQISEQTTDLSDIQEAVDQATADVAVMQSSIVAMAGIVETTRQLATDNKETIGQGTLDTVAQTLIGATNELNEKIGNYETLYSYDASATTTYGDALNALYSLIDSLNNIPITAKILMENASNVVVYDMIQHSIAGGFMIFGRDIYAANALGRNYLVLGSSSTANNIQCTGDGITNTPTTSTAIGIATKISIIN